MGLDSENVETSDFNVDEISIEAIGNDSQSISANDSDVEGQTGKSPNETADEKVASSEDILKLVANEKENPAESTELLGKINSLGLIRNGMPVSIESPEQLKEVIQKGFDYTQKTMEHAETVKAKEQEWVTKEAQFTEREAQFTQREQQHETVFRNNDIIADMLVEMQTNDPELYAEIDRLFIKQENAFNQQFKHTEKFNGEIKNLRGEIQSLRGENQAKELGQIKQGWEKGLSETQASFAAPLAKLGVKADWEKVKAAWSADTSNTMTVEQALHAVHGKDILSANQSYQKLLATKNKSQAAMLGRTGVGGSSKGGSSAFKGELGNFDQLIDHIVANEKL
jgi:hypothetical protein